MTRSTPSAVRRSAAADDHRTRTIAAVPAPSAATAALVTTPASGAPSATTTVPGSDGRRCGDRPQDAGGMAEVADLGHRFLAEEAALGGVDRGIEARFGRQGTLVEVRSHPGLPMADPPHLAGIPADLDEIGGHQALAFPDGGLPARDDDVLALTQDRGLQAGTGSHDRGVAHQPEDRELLGAVAQGHVRRQHVGEQQVADGSGLFGMLQQQEPLVVASHHEVGPDPSGGCQQQGTPRLPMGEGRHVGGHQVVEPVLARRSR